MRRLERDEWCPGDIAEGLAYDLGDAVQRGDRAETHRVALLLWQAIIAIGHDYDRRAVRSAAVCGRRGPV